MLIKSPNIRFEKYSAIQNLYIYLHITHLTDNAL